LLTLAGCGGGGGGGETQPPVTNPPAETVFIAANAWTGATPASAETIAADELRRRVASGELIIVTAGTPEAQRSARQSQFGQDRAFIEGLSDRGDDLDALMSEVTAAGGMEGERQMALPDGSKIVLLDLGTRVHQAAESYRQAHDVALARDNYSRVFALLSSDEQSQIQSPASLTSASLEDVATAEQAIDGVLAQRVNLDNVHIEPEATPAHLLRVRQQAGSGPGNGTDISGACASSGIYKSYWYPLKKFVSPVKWQGRRGTCWAFAAIGAVESRERVQNDNAVDLSEQFLVHKYKRDWEPASLVDAGSSERALNAAVDHNQSLVMENAWTYNLASRRPAEAFDEGVAGTLRSYADACTNYNGWCSETAHESPVVCATSGGVTVCGWESISPGGAAVPASRARQVWSNGAPFPGEPFRLNEYRALLAAGYALIGTFPIYEGIQAAPNDGVVSNYDRKKKDKNGNLVDGSYGGHLALLVGFISNEDLSFAGIQSNVGGGGYFVMRNSWGCGAGDGGYFYVPADYVSSIFSSLSVLDFDARRSARWSAEQQLPGSTDPLSINPLGTTAVDLRVPTDLAKKFEVKHAVANYVRLIVRSDVDGLLYDGQWLVNAPPNGGLFANSLPVNFQTPGARTLTIIASYGSQVASTSKTVTVTNSAPKISFNFTGDPQQGEPFLVRAILSDINEPDPSALCAATQWSVDAPDAIVSGEGCSRTLRFGAAGSRSLTVRTHDREGLEAARIAVFTVAPPPVNPYPRITDAGLFARRSDFFGCTLPRVDTGATIDLRERGCVLAGDPPTRYFGQIAVENPDAESLSYDWTYSAYLFESSVVPDAERVTHTTVPAYDFEGSRFTVGAAPVRCTLTVRVNAPDSARSKTLTIWSGRCINYADIN
jgi:C1A family cysteine protease